MNPPRAALLTRLLRPLHNRLSAPKEAFLVGDGNEILPDSFSIAAASQLIACQKIPLCSVLFTGLTDVKNMKNVFGKNNLILICNLLFLSGLCAIMGTQKIWADQDYTSFLTETELELQIELQSQWVKAIEVGDLATLQTLPPRDWNEPILKKVIISSDLVMRSSRWRLEKESPLHYWSESVWREAVSDKHMAMLEWLLQQGARANFRDLEDSFYRSTELALPYLLKIYEVLPEEIEGTADEHISFELWKKQVDWFARLIPYYAKHIPQGVFKLHDALLNRDHAGFKAALALSADINEADALGNTALHLAIYMQDTEAIELLLARGADVKGRNDFGEYMLHLLIQRPILRYLIPSFEALGADYLACDQWLGAMPLHYCEWDTGYTREMNNETNFAPCILTSELEACLRWVEQGGLIDKEVPFLGSVSDMLYGAEDPALREWAMGLTTDCIYRLCNEMQRSGGSYSELIPYDEKAIAIVRHNGLVLGALEVWARQLHKVHPQVHFYIVEPSMIEREPELLERFCGFILPGSPEGHDKSYAAALQDKALMESPRVKAYLQVLDYADRHRLPVVGICGGHQFMGLWHKGDGMVPQDQSDKNDMVGFPAGNLVYWMLLSAEEKAEVEVNCALPQVAFAVVRMHGNAIDLRNPGNGLSVAATSPLGTVMSVTDNVHKVGVQFHPEMVAYNMGENPESHKRYAQFFESFIEMVDRAYDAQHSMGCRMSDGCDAAQFEDAVYGPYKQMIEHMRRCVSESQGNATKKHIEQYAETVL